MGPQWVLGFSSMGPLWVLGIRGGKEENPRTHRGGKEDSKKVERGVMPGSEHISYPCAADGRLPTEECDLSPQNGVYSWIHIKKPLSSQR